MRTAFGDMFINEVMGLKRGFVDIPVGARLQAFTISRISEPFLKLSISNEIRATGREDLCMSRSLASALYAMGWHEAAIKVDGLGEEILNGAVVEAIDRVSKFT